MFCKNCGKAFKENEKFCASCGMASGKTPQPTVEHEVTNVEVVVPEVVSTPAGLSCPKCQSNNTHATIAQNISGGGFSAGKGCLGFLFFGPLGLLCGSCGSSVKTEHKTIVLCNDCGNTFQASQDRKGFVFAIIVFFIAFIVIAVMMLGSIAMFFA